MDKCKPRVCPHCGCDWSPIKRAGPRKHCYDDVCEAARERANTLSERINRKAHERAKRSGSKFEWVDPTKVFIKSGWRCAACNQESPSWLRGTLHQRAPELDHIVPISVGGPHSLSNVQLLCRSCNASKGEVIDDSTLFTSVIAKAKLGVWGSDLWAPAG